MTLASNSSQCVSTQRVMSLTTQLNRRFGSRALPGERKLFTLSNLGLPEAVGKFLLSRETESLRLKQPAYFSDRAVTDEWFYPSKR